MKDLLELLVDYNREKHIELIKNEISKEKLEWDIIPIYSERWKEKDRVPYEIITFLIDAYSNLPVRTDLAFLFCWQAFNNAYNQMLLKEQCSTRRLNDTKGIERFIDEVLNKYDEKYDVLLKPYILEFPPKLSRYIATYILKGYVIKNSFENKPKYYNSSYDGLCKRFPEMLKVIEDTYGIKYKDICNPILLEDKVKLNISKQNKTKAKQLIDSLADKLRTLLIEGEVEIEDKINNKTIKLSIDTKGMLELLVYGIIYSSRCNNFHGNIASRLNSIYSKKEDTYHASKYLFLLTHILLGIALYINGNISEDCLIRLKGNEKYLSI